MHVSTNITSGIDPTANYSVGLSAWRRGEFARNTGAQGSDILLRTDGEQALGRADTVASLKVGGALDSAIWFSATVPVPVES
jgi:hypothetical protein